MRVLYFSMVHSVINYCILTWGFRCERIIKLQKIIIRIISNSRYSAHTEPLFKKLNILKFEHIFKLSATKLYFRYCKDNLPVYFCSFNLTPQSQVHQYNTRSNNNISSTVTRTSYARKCLRHYLPILINSLPNNVIDKVRTHSYEGFSIYVKKFFISSYVTECCLLNCYTCNIYL